MMKEIIEYIEEQIKEADKKLNGINCHLSRNMYIEGETRGYLIAMENVLKEIIARGLNK